MISASCAKSAPLTGSIVGSGAATPGTASGAILRRAFSATLGFSAFTLAGPWVDVAAPGEQDQVEPAPGQLARKRFAEPFRRSGYQGPGAIAMDKGIAHSFFSLVS